MIKLVIRELTPALLPTPAEKPSLYYIVDTLSHEPVEESVLVYYHLKAHTVLTTSPGIVPASIALIIFGTTP